MAKRRWKMDEIKAVVAGENPFYQSGYTPTYKSRKVGDEWTDGKGKTWKKTKSGIESVNKQMDVIRELVKSRCKVCGMNIDLFGDKTDKKVFLRTRKCFSCLEIEEMTLKVTGKYDDYEKKKLFHNKLSLLKEFRKNVIESIAYLRKDDSKLEMVCSNGQIVTWSGGSEIEPLLKEAESDLVKADKEIADITHAISVMESDDTPKATA
jgi:hypothetical protein